MFTIETAAGDPEARPDRRQKAHAPAENAGTVLSRLTDPAWLFETLWRRKGLIILAAVLGLLLAALASLLIPPKYVSTAQLFIDPRDLRVLQNEVSPNAVGGDPTSITGYLESQARVIASDSIKSRVVESEGLDKDPEFGGEAASFGLGSLLSRFLPQNGAPGRDAMLYALAALDKNVTVRRGERTFVVDISVSAREAAKAARIANALANAYLEDQASVRADAAQRATTALTSRLEELRNRLRIAEDKTEAYKEANGIVGVGDGKSITDEQLALNNAQLVAQRTRVTEAKAKYDQTLATRPSGIEAGAVPEAVSSNTMSALRAQLGAALNREADMQSSLGARHPSLASAQAQVRDARRQIADELARIARAAKIEYDRAVAAERQIAQRVDQLSTRQYAAGRASVELRELEREVESSRVLYDAFLRRARETGELAAIDTTNARIISAAMPALEKTGISRRTIAMLGAIGGGGVGALIVLGLALTAGTATLAPPSAATPAPTPAPAPPPAQPRPRQPQSTKSGLGFFRRRKPSADAETPPPAELEPGSADRPSATPPTSGTAQLSSPQSPADKAAAPRFATIQGGQAERLPNVLQAAHAPRLATLPAVRHRRWRRVNEAPRSVFQSKAHLVDVLDKPNAGFARAVHAARLALVPDQTQTARRILVLGLAARAGASTLALNLALDAAQDGLPAMLVDAGLGATSLTAIFAPDAEIGLHEIVTGAAGVVRAALQDEGSGLFFLPRAGRSDLVTSEQIGASFFSQTRRFGPLIIDGAALDSDPLSQHFADVVDDIVLVLRENVISPSELARINAVLGRNAAKIRGFVVNEAR